MIEKKWNVAEKLPLEADTALLAYPQGFRQLLYNRGIYTAVEADHYLFAEGSIYDPFLLSGMENVVTRIASAISNREKIVVYGDYDVDGVSATALLVQVLSAFNAGVEAYIPNRFDEGYGLNIEALDELAANGARLIVTVDCGIRAVREITHAKQIGLDVIISDHHHPGHPLPPAFEIINPKKTEDKYPEKNLSGVGVAYKIAQALSERISEPCVNVDAHLDLVALGTVADIVPLTGENRALVKAGIKKMREGQNKGLSSLAGAAGINIHQVNARDIGFMLGPRLNAAGRITSARAAYDLLVAIDDSQTSLLAQKLDDLNRKRQGMVVQMVEIARKETSGDEVNLVLSFHPDYEQGVVGLVASRLTEEFYRPSMIGQIKGEIAVASCRSIPGFHITEALDQCADLLDKHGGHEMAAGFTIHIERIPELRQRMIEIANERLDGQDLRPILRADYDIPLRKLPADILDAISKIEPTGQANPEVVFVSRNLHVVRKKLVGGDQHLSLQLRDGTKTYPAIAFRKGSYFEKLPDQIDLMYTLMRNEYNNTITTQLNVIDLKPSSDAL